MANTVTLTFAGETKDVEQSFDRVGKGAKTMGDKVGESAGGFHRAGEAADEVDTKAMGFRDTLTGVQDSAKGASMVMKGDLFNGMLTLGMGVGDLGSGFYNFLIPAMEKAKLGTLAKAAADKVAAGASRVWAGAQWLMNTALFASPITWIVVGILLLIGIIVLIATKTDWFQKAWKAAWGWIKDAASSTWEFIKKIPGWIGSAFMKIGDYVFGPFKWAFNQVAKAWNATIGKLSWTVPSWVPFIGGNSISVPNLPTFHAGGRVPGAPGQNVLAMLQAGETVSSAAGGSSAMALEVHSGGTKLDDLLVEILAGAVRRRGGNVQLVLGGGGRG
jgi:hypothetical protein